MNIALHQIALFYNVCSKNTEIEVIFTKTENDNEKKG